MTKRNHIFISTLILIELIWTSYLFSSMKSPDEFKNKMEPIQEFKNENFLSFPFMVLIKVYQITISPVKGSSCTMHPHCSQYGMESIKKNGLLGLLQTADRLNRCGHDTHFYNKVIIGDKIKNFDPVKENKSNLNGIKSNE